MFRNGKKLCKLSAVSDVWTHLRVLLDRNVEVRRHIFVDRTGTSLINGHKKQIWGSLEDTHGRNHGFWKYSSYTIPKVTLQRRLGRKGLRWNSCDGLNSRKKPQLIFYGYHLGFFGLAIIERGETYMYRVKQQKWFEARRLFNEDLKTAGGE